jgi:hypothetical protein
MLLTCTENGVLLNQTDQFPQRQSIRVPASAVTALLFSFFVLAFVITPYWLLPGSTSTRLAFLAVTLVSGLTWSMLSGGALQISMRWKDAWSFYVLLLLILLLNFRALGSDLPWRGDEAFHISNILSVAQEIAENGRWVAAALAGLAAFLFLAWKKPRWGGIFGALFLILLLFFLHEKQPFQNGDSAFLIRYPFVSYWFDAIVPAIAARVASPYEEALYRLAPFLFAVGIAWVFQNRFSTFHPLVRLLLGLSAATLPIIFYYTSICYLEMPAIFLMLVVCFSIQDLCTQRAAALKSNPAWYMLICIGFIKETTLPFLLAVLIFRWAVQLNTAGLVHALFKRSAEPRLEWKSRLRSLVREELAISYSVLLPIGLYLGIRSFFSVSRTFGMQIENFLQPAAYTAYLRSFLDQFGIFFPLFLAGGFLLISQKKYLQAGFLAAVFIGYPVFFILDTWIYAGYSRFNLFLVPPVLVGASVCIIAWGHQKRFLAPALALLALFVSLVLTPIQLDGTKKPYWDAYNTDTAEHYYPYREAMAWLKQTYPTQPVLSGGLTYGYALSFYEKKFDQPVAAAVARRETEDASTALKHAIAKADQQNIPLILFHVLNDGIPQPDPNSQFRQIAVFRNQAHELVIYGKETP